MVGAEAASPQPTRAVGGLDPHQQVLRGGDGLGRHLHRRLQRQRHRNGVDAADDERRMRRGARPVRQCEACPVFSSMRLR